MEVTSNIQIKNPKFYMNIKDGGNNYIVHIAPKKGYKDIYSMTITNNFEPYLDIKTIYITDLLGFLLNTNNELFKTIYIDFTLALDNKAFTEKTVDL